MTNVRFIFMRFWIRSRCVLMAYLCKIYELLCRIQSLMEGEKKKATCKKPFQENIGESCVFMCEINHPDSKCFHHQCQILHRFVRIKRHQFSKQLNSMRKIDSHIWMIRIIARIDSVILEALFYFSKCYQM